MHANKKHNTLLKENITKKKKSPAHEYVYAQRGESVFRLNEHIGKFNLMQVLGILYQSIACILVRTTL